MNNIHKYLTVDDGDLRLEGVGILEIADKFGTPVYVYSASTIIDNIKNLMEGLAKNMGVEVFYAMKSLSHMDILRLIRSMGLGVETVSLGEVEKAIEVGFNPREMIYNGLGKDMATLKRLASLGLKAVNLDSEYEVYIAYRMGLFNRDDLDIGIRLNLSISKEVLDTASKTSKFGLEYSVFEELAKKYGIRKIGLHCHLGSQITKISLWSRYIDELISVINRVGDGLGLEITYLDIGGGLPKDYIWTPITLPIEDLDIKLFRPKATLRELVKILDRLRRALGRDTPLMMEPGRYVVADSGILVTKIVGFKERSWGDRWIFLDTGFTHLLSGFLYKWYFPLVNASRISEAHDTPYRVAGILCDSDDIFHDYMGEKSGMPMLPRYRFLPRDTYVGDILAFLHVGAYNYEEASTYNSVDIPRLVLIGGNENIQDI